MHSLALRAHCEEQLSYLQATQQSLKFAFIYSLLFNSLPSISQRATFVSQQKATITAQSPPQCHSSCLPQHPFPRTRLQLAVTAVIAGIKGSVRPKDVAVVLPAPLLEHALFELVTMPYSAASPTGLELTFTAVIAGIEGSVRPEDVAVVIPAPLLKPALFELVTIALPDVADLVVVTLGRPRSHVIPVGKAVPGVVIGRGMLAP